MDSGKDEITLTKEHHENSFIKLFPLIIGCLIVVLFFLFNYLFNTFTPFIQVENNGFLISDEVALDTLKSSNNDKNILLKTVGIKENDYIYKTLNNYVNNSRTETVNLYYPFYINDGISIVNYNDETNLIDNKLKRSSGLVNHVYSYGNIYNMSDYNVIDNEDYLLLSYPNSMYVTLYDLKIKTELNEYIIPLNSIIYFSEEYLNYYERGSHEFIKKEILDIDYNSTITFYYESANEEYSYNYENFLIGIGKIFKKEEIDVPPKPIIEEDDVIEQIDEEEEIPVVINKPEFVWIKPSVKVEKFNSGVYSLESNLTISDPAGVIVKPPTFTIISNGKTYSRKSFYLSGKILIGGLIPSSEFQIVGQYTYLDEDLKTKKIVTFYYDTIQTQNIDELDSIDIKYSLGDIYARKLELKNVKIVSDLQSEVISGVRNVSFTVNGDIFYISKKKLIDLLNGEEIDELSSSESLNSNSEYDFELEFYDVSGNKLVVNNNVGHSRTSKKNPIVSLKVLENEVDYLIIGVDLRNDDNVEINNYRYEISNTSGQIVNSGIIDGNRLRISNLNPNQMFTIKVMGDFDLNDNIGLRKDYEIASMDFTSLPISSLGFINLNINIMEVTKNSFSFSYKISDKTDVRLVRLLKNMNIMLYEKDTGEFIRKYELNEFEISELILNKELNLIFSGLDSNTSYTLKIDSIIKQGDTVFNYEVLNDFTDVKTRKKTAQVILENSFTNDNMIDFDIKIIDSDNAVLSNAIRLELRDVTNKLIDSRIINTNSDFERITYNYLKKNQNYIILVIADEYNETDNNDEFLSKYVITKLNRFTQEGISGKIELRSAIRVANGENLVDMNSETKWIQTYNYYTIPKTIDDDGIMHIYSRTGAAAYMYDLSDYHNEIVTATFKIKAVNPLNEAFKIYFTNYLPNTSSAAYGIRLDDISKDKWTNFTYTFRVGSYKSGNHFVNNNSKYYGKYYTDFIGFYLTGGSTTLAEYMVKDFEIHISKNRKEVDLSSYTIEKGAYNSNGTDNNSGTNNDYRARLSDGIVLEGDNIYEFDLGDSNDYSAYIYFTDLNNKYVSAYGWFDSKRVVYVPQNVKVYLMIRYFSGNVVIDPNSVDLTITKFEEKDNIPYEDFQYDYVTKTRINLNDLRNEIADNTYYIKVYDLNNRQVVKIYDYEELMNSNIIETEKKIDLEENKNYKISLFIKIRDREYELDNFDITTNSEVRGIATVQDWAYLQPNGNYIVLNDLDFKDFTLQTLGWGYRYFNGIIDFQGYSADVYSSTKAYQRIGRIDKNGILKNMVLNVHLNNTINNNSIRGFVSSNYGLIENTQIHVFDEREEYFNDLYLNTLVDINYSTGIIRNFFIKLEDKVNLFREVGLLTRYNYGIVENGYVYGENVVASLESTASTRPVSLIQRYGGVKSIVRNVYTLSSIEFPNNYASDLTGLISYETYGKLKNVYTVGNVSNINQAVGPVVGYARATAEFEKVYYMSDYVYTMANQTKISPLNLNDAVFQENLFGESFNVSAMIKLGYYPQVNFSFKKMPKQEYIELPPYDSDNYVDIIDMEIISKESEKARIKMVVDNPLGEDITSIVITDLKTSIISQTFEDGKSYVIFDIENPAVYVSRYAIRSISSRGYNGIVTSKTYTIGEKYLFIDFYKEINTVEDWIKINNSLNQNYIINNDLDFSLYVNYTIGTFTGKINGNNHVLKNITITNKDGLFTQMNGTLEDIYFENIVKYNNTTNSGLIGYSNQNAKFNNVHVKNVNILVPESRTSDNVYVGGLVGQVYYSKFINTSINNVKINSSANISGVNAGGMVGYSNGGVYSNTYAADVDIVVEKAKGVAGVGGLVGREAASVASISYSYSSGNLKVNGRNVGGIVGSTAGYVENCMSIVNVYSDLTVVGGIAGYATDKTYINNNLALGNITYFGNSEFAGRIVGNFEVLDNNFAYDNMLINGLKSDIQRGEQLLSYSKLLVSENYDSEQALQLGEVYDYSKVSEGIIPKLFYMDNDTLLPNQKDIYLEKENFEISDIVIDKHTDYSNIVIYIKNPLNLNISNIKINDMNIDIVKNQYENNISIIEIDAFPLKYYDSYVLSEITYTEGENEFTIPKSLVLEMPFYKKLSSYNDWQNVSTVYPENYILTNDIDFTDKTFNTNVVFNRLETENDSLNYTLKGMNYVYNKAGNDICIIDRINTSLKNINFDNITITNNQTSGNDYINIICYANGIMENVNFTNIVIDAPYKNRVAPVGRAYTDNIDNINLSNVTINGKSYIAGFLAYYFNNNEHRYIRNVNASDIHVTGSSHYVGGIFATQSSETTDDEKLIEKTNISDSEIISTGGNYVGGIASYGSSNDSLVTNVHVKGNQYVGGAFGYAKNNYTRYITVKDSNIEVVSNYGGGIAGQTRYLYDSVVDNTTITGIGTATYGVGGIIGFINGYTVYRSVVTNSQIINNGKYSGGIVGYMTGGEIHTSSTNNTTITGNNDSGGISGRMDAGNITTSKVTSSFINAQQSNAGGIIGYLNNLNQGVTFREGYFRHTLVAKTNVQSKSYAGGILGKKNELLIYPNEDYSLYFEGNVISEDEITGGIGSGDEFNKEIINLGRTGFYEYSKINNQTLTSLVNERETENLVTELNLGFINTSDGTEDINYNYPNAHYTNFIRLKKGNVYRIKASNSNKAYNDIFRVRLYDIDQNYLVDYYGTPSYVFSYFADYNTFAYMDEAFLTPIRDCYIKVQFYYDTEENIVTKVASSYDDLSMEKLLNYGQLRNRITWNRYLSQDLQDFYYKTFFSFDASYWDFSPLNNEVSNFEITDNSGKGYNTTANASAIDKKGLFFGGNRDTMEVPNFTPNSDITISTRFISYSSRSWQYLFSYRNPNNSSQGIGLFVHGKTLYVTINGSNYSINYSVPNYREISVTLTYQNNKVLKVYVDGNVVYTNNNVNKKIATGDNFKTYISTDIYYNSDSYKFLGIIENMIVFNRALDASEVLNNYNSSGITNMDGVEILYDFTNVDYSNIGYYPIHKWSSTDVILREQALVPLPTKMDTYSGMNLLGNGRRLMGSFNSSLEGKYHVYSSGINTINLEFDKISDDLSFTYKIGDKEYSQKVERRVYSLNYDYVSDIEIVIKNSFETKTITLTKDALAHTILVYNNNYYHINGNSLYSNNEYIKDGIVHLYNNLALMNNGKIYNLDTLEYQNAYLKEGILSYEIPLYESTINNKIVKTYYNFTEIIDQNNNSIYRDKLIIYKDGSVFVHSPSIENDNSSLIVNNYNNSIYEFVLGKNKEIYSYQMKMNSDEYLLNSDIVEIRSDFTSNSPIIMIKYTSGKIIALNYYSGEKLFEYGDNNEISFFDYLKLSIQSNNIVSNNKSYQESNDLINELNSLTNDDIKKILDETKNNGNENVQENNNSITNLDESNNAITNKNIIKNIYSTNYNDKTNTYDVYDIDDILNTTLPDVPTIIDKISSNNVLHEYFNNSTKISALLSDNRTLIYGGIIILVIVNLIYLVIRYRKGDKHA